MRNIVSEIEMKKLRISLKHKKYFGGIAVCIISISIITFVQPLIIRQITDRGMIGKDIKCILDFSIFLLLISLMGQIIEVIQTSLFSDAHNEFTCFLYTKVYWKMNRLKLQYFDEKGSADFTNMIRTDISNMASITDQITAISVSSILQVGSGIIGLSIIDWKMAIFVVSFIPIKYGIISYFSKRKSVVMQEWIENERKFSGWFGDCIHGIYEMKVWNLFQFKSNRFEKLQRKMLESYRKNIMLDQYRNISMSMLDSVINAVLYILAGVFIVNNKLTVGSAFAFITYSGYIMSPISFFVNMKYYFAQIKPSAERFSEFLQQPEENQGNIKEEANNYCDAATKHSIVEVEHVCFGYSPEQLVLRDVSFSVYPGEKIAIIGENGSGKSTLLNVLSGIYQAQQGEIKIQGCPVSMQGVEKLREKLAVIPQNPYLFQGTIEENINVDGKSSYEEVVSACEKSGALAFITKLENGFDYQIGKNAAKLSGGEKQKIAVARALLKEADILLMDEATEGYDAESSMALHRLLCAELAEKTIIFVTHRYEKLEDVDKVYRLSNGVINQI